MATDDLDPQHTVRVSQALWDEVRAIARKQRKRDGVSQVIREQLEAYAKKHRHLLDER